MSDGEKFKFLTWRETLASLRLTEHLECIAQVSIQLKGWKMPWPSFASSYRPKPFAFHRLLYFFDKGKAWGHLEIGALFQEMVNSGMEEHTKAALAEKANVDRIKTAVVVLNDVVYRMFRQQMVQENHLSSPKVLFQHFYNPGTKTLAVFHLDVQHAQRRARPARPRPRRTETFGAFGTATFCDSWPRGSFLPGRNRFGRRPRILSPERSLARHQSPVRPPRERVVDESDGNVREDAHGGHHHRMRRHRPVLRLGVPALRGHQPSPRPPSQIPLFEARARGGPGARPRRAEKPVLGLRLSVLIDKLFRKKSDLGCVVVEPKSPRPSPRANLLADLRRKKATPSSNLMAAIRSKKATSSNLMAAIRSKKGNAVFQPYGGHSKQEGNAVFQPYGGHSKQENSRNART